MNIIERSRSFVEELRARAKRSVWDWRRCSWCGSTWTIKNGGYWRHPWTKTGRVHVRIQRHRCFVCRRSYAEEQAWLVRGSWYARAVHRYAVDWWVHGRSSLRRVAEMLRSEMGHQERWGAWEVWEERLGVSEVCRFAASTLQRWLNKAGEKAQESVPGQLEGVATSGQMGSDGLWVRAMLRIVGVRPRAWC
jgi:transposase-like protein